jgi:hypothetical protein
VDYAPAEGVSNLEATIGHRFGSRRGRYFDRAADLG